MRIFLLTIALLISTGPLLADVLRATDAGVVVEAVGPTERQANLNNLQAAVDQAEAATHKTLELPDGDVWVDATPTRRYLAIDKSLNLRSAGQTRIHLGPDTLGSPGFAHPNDSWSLFRVLAKNLTLDIGPGITLVGPNVDGSRFAGNTTFAPPSALYCEGISTSNIQRRINLDGLKILGNWNEGIVLADHKVFTPLTNVGTLLTGRDLEIETKGNGIVAFGTKGNALDIRGLRMVCGGTYPSGDSYGLGGYSHQGSAVSIVDADITTSGRGCWKDAGTNSEGGTPGRFVNCTFRSLKPGFGIGLALDKFADRVVSGCIFESSLNIGIELYGKGQSVDNVFMCPVAFGGAGGLSGDRPTFVSIGDRFIGVREVWALAMENAHVKFVDSVVVPAPGAILWSLPDTPKTATMRVELIRPVVRGDLRSVCAMDGGQWLIDGLTFEGAASHGTFAGAMRNGSATVRGGEWDKTQTFHHSASEANKGRVLFTE